MNRVEPPHWLERTLSLLLSARDQESVSGDLYEEFQEEKVRRLGPFRARLWYARQLLSFAPRRMGALFVQRRVLTLLCIFTALSGCWLAAMGLRLKHPGYAQGEVIAATIVFQALLTLAALRMRRLTFLRPLAMVGCLALFWLAGTALLATLRGSHLEGYVLLIALALILQVLLTLSTLPRAQDQPELKA